jgi:YjbE family integral membrane protein
MEWFTDLFTMQFLTALATIVVIDLVLAGDNAIVIALAARNLPPHLQKKAIVWGTVGAVIVRSAMTIGVVWLLKIPGLLLVGGLALVWIAYKLLSDDGDGDEHGAGATTLVGAMKTIIIADAVMGVDNVLAVAGAAHGSFLLVVLGLLISIPIVVWGSGLVLKLMARFPAIIYVGAGVLAFTAAKMITHEPLVRAFFDSNPLAWWGLMLVVIGGVLGGGYLAKQRVAKAGTARHDTPALP